MSTTNHCCTPRSSCSRCQRGSQRERYNNSALPCLCCGVSRFGKDLSYTMVRVRGGKTSFSRDQLDEAVVIILGKVISAKALFEYSAGLGSGFRVWCLGAILRPKKSVKLKCQKAWF